MNDFTVLIVQFGLVQLINGKMGRNHVNKLCNQRTTIDVLLANGLLIRLFAFLLVFLLVNETKHNLPIIILRPGIQKWRGSLVLKGLIGLYIDFQCSFKFFIQYCDSHIGLFSILPLQLSLFQLCDSKVVNLTSS